LGYNGPISRTSAIFSHMSNFEIAKICKILQNFSNIGYFLFLTVILVQNCPNIISKWFSGSLLPSKDSFYWFLSHICPTKKTICFIFTRQNRSCNCDVSCSESWKMAAIMLSQKKNNCAIHNFSKTYIFLLYYSINIEILKINNKVRKIFFTSYLKKKQNSWKSQICLVGNVRPENRSVRKICSLSLVSCSLYLGNSRVLQIGWLISCSL
jgi:hypothetical protein